MSFHENLLNKKNRPRSVQPRIQRTGNDNASKDSIEKNPAAVGDKVASDSEASLAKKGRGWRGQADGWSQDKSPESVRPYSVAGLASRWECSEGIIRGLIRNETLEHFRVGTLVRIRASEVERFECR